MSIRNSTSLHRLLFFFLPLHKLLSQIDLMNRFDDMLKWSLQVLILCSVLLNQRKNLSLLKYYLTWVPIKISLCKQFTWIKCCSLETNKDLPCFKMFTKSFNKRTCAGSNRSCCTPGFQIFCFSLSGGSLLSTSLRKQVLIFLQGVVKEELATYWSLVNAGPCLGACVKPYKRAQFNLRWVGPVT